MKFTTPHSPRPSALQRLVHMPRRKWLALAAAGLMSSTSGTSFATTITLGPNCDLYTALYSAESDSAVWGCPAGNGADTIILPANTHFPLGPQHPNEVESGQALGGSAFPPVRTPITIKGNGSTFELVAGDVRHFTVLPGGKLRLEGLTLKGGNLVNLFKLGSGFPSYIAASGGSILNWGGVVELSKVTVTGNNAPRGGGIANISNYGAAVSTVRIEDSAISGNKGSANEFDWGVGGGLYNYMSQPSGGGVRMEVIRSTVSSNISGEGGGIVSGSPYVGAPVSLSVINSTISLNEATVSPGGIYNNGAGLLYLISSTVTHNKAANGAGGISIDKWLTPTVFISRSLVAGNSHRGYDWQYGQYGSLSGQEIRARGQNYVVGACNLFGHRGNPKSPTHSSTAFNGFKPGPSDLVATADGNKPQALNYILHPTLADNGGHTRTHALPSGSFAINGAAPCGANQPTDQRGITRPQGGADDIGAFEFFNAKADVSVKVAASSSSVALGSQLTYTLTAANLGPSSTSAVTLYNSLPLGLDYVSATSSQGSCSYDAATTGIECAIGNLASGANAVVTVKVKASKVGSITNSASVIASTAIPDPDTSNNQASTTVSVTSSSALTCAVALPTSNCSVNGVTGSQCVGTSGNDNIVGTEGNDVIFAHGGADTVTTLGGADLICGGSGSDTLYGGAGNDTIEGGSGNDKLYGNDGNDKLLGGDGDDNLNGGAGTDTANGGSNTDTCVAETKSSCEK